MLAWGCCWGDGAGADRGGGEVLKLGFLTSRLRKVASRNPTCSRFQTRGGGCFPAAAQLLSPDAGAQPGLRFHVSPASVQVGQFFFFFPLLCVCVCAQFLVINTPFEVYLFLGRGKGGGGREGAKTACDLKLGRSDISSYYGAFK